mmetsp:Transcript_1458/g.2114  ORF Transcript_1458/g.2114 Transcript_1458/m.2114 type:complete len:88 (-) Transcript_1458:1143-1406(-)
MSKMMNRYPNVKPLFERDMYACLAELANDFDTEEQRSVPPTFILPDDIPKFKAYKKACPKAIFMAKFDAAENETAQFYLMKKRSDLP